MITPGMLTAMTTMDPIDLVLILEDSGYNGCWFLTAEFKGITRTGAFSYEVTYDDGDGLGVQSGFVYVNYDYDRDVYTAEF